MRCCLLEQSPQNAGWSEAHIPLCRVASSQTLLQVPVFEIGVDAKPAEIAKQGLAKARAEGYDAIIVDTAGRLQVCGADSVQPPLAVQHAPCMCQPAQPSRAAEHRQLNMMRPGGLRRMGCCPLSCCSRHDKMRAIRSCRCARADMAWDAAICLVLRTVAVWLQIDPAMMSELREVQATVQPSDTLLVVDAMTGQEAAGLVKAFNEAAEITGEASPSSCTLQTAFACRRCGREWLFGDTRGSSITAA